MAGDTAIVSLGNPTMNSLAISGETINLTNTGSITTNQATGAAGTSFDNTTKLSATNGQTLTTNGAFTNAGVITDVTLAYGDTFAGPANFVNNGVVSYDIPNSSGTGYTNSGRNATFVNNGQLNVLAPAGSYQNNSNIAALPYTLAVSSNFAGTGNVQITGGFPNNGVAPGNSGNTQEQLIFGTNAVVSGSNTFFLNDALLQFNAANSGNVVFQDGTSTLALPGVATPDGVVVTGFRLGDAITFNGSTLTSFTYNAANGALTVSDASRNSTTITVLPTGTQTYTMASFSINPNFNGQSGNTALVTSAAAPCYCPGTMIQTARGEVAVEALEIGDTVTTVANGEQPIRWIGRRSFTGRFVEDRLDILPVRIAAGALADGTPKRDLVVSPLHAMFLDGVLVPASALVNGVTITQATAVDRVEYIHIELAAHDVIWAEGAASETFVDDSSRGMFHNAADFATRYPAARPVAARYCAPRVESGEALAAINRAIDVRAGLSSSLPRTLRGQLDTLRGGVLHGWAQDPSRPDVPVCLEILVDGRVAGHALANGFRGDLLAAGVGQGRHGFVVDLASLPAGTVTVRVAGDAFNLGEVRRAA